MKKLLPLLLCLFSQTVLAQNFIRDVIITTDSGGFALSKSAIEYRQKQYLYFVMQAPDESLEVTISTTRDLDSLQILSSGSIVVFDQLVKTADRHYSGTIKLKDFLDNPYNRLILRGIENGQAVNNVVWLYPFIFPQIPDIAPTLELFTGQELSEVIPISKTYFLKYQPAWQKRGFIDYKLTPGSQGPLLTLRANRSGTQQLVIPIETTRPFLTADGLVSRHLTDLVLHIKSVFSRINYLNFDKPSYYFEPLGGKAITVQFEYNRNIKLNRTYRIEDQEKPGGRLIAELFTRAIIENQNKVVATLRTYALHRTEEGFLYIKLNDVARFFTNFNILKKPEISKISILRPAKDWTTSLLVYPGETIELKIEGVGLDHSQVKFSDGKYSARIDTARLNEHVIYAELTIPFDVEERSIPISLNGAATSFELLVKEYERPRPFDFVLVNYGDGPKVLNGELFQKPVLYKSEIGDLVIYFDENAIDEPDRLYGTQFMEMEVKFWDKQKKLIESRIVHNIKIVPGPASVRYLGYNRANASNPFLKLNDIMVNKTHELRPWSKIEIILRHDRDKYGGQGYDQHIEIYRSDDFATDIEVSFPAGLLAKKLDEPGVGTLTGLSVASMAQFSFYKKNQINKLQPLRVGVGFIALNAFSSITNTNGEDDIGIVVLASFRPLRPDSKVNFPIYGGFGYLLKSESMFLLIGPGVQFNF